MILSRRFALRPSREQRAALGRAAGAARKAWNWGLDQKQKAWAKRKAALDSGMAPELAPKVPTAIDLHKELNKLKKVPAEEGGFSWMYESSKCAPQEALRNLDDAFGHFFRRVKAGETPGHPRFKARYRTPGQFRLTGVIRVMPDSIRLPRIGNVRIMPGDREWAPNGEHGTVAITEEGDRWFASIHIEVEEAPAKEGSSVGLDAGVRDLAHLSDGTVFENPRAMDREKRRLRRSRLSIRRKQRAADKRLGTRKKGEHRKESNRLRLERHRAARLAVRVKNIRKDALHKATTKIAKVHATVVVEDLRIKNMTRARKGRGRAAKAGLNRAILDSGMGRLRGLLSYKMPLHGGQLIIVPAAYTSRRCSRCGAMNDPGTSKIYECEMCGLVIDRDLNASLNILAAASWSEAKNARGGAVRPMIFGPKARSRETRIEAVA